MKPTKPKHTPGPWYALKYPDVKTYTVAAKGSVASKIKTIEDAHLIAAAPDMLEALELVLEKVDRLGGDMKYGPILSEQNPEGFTVWYRKARAAIAKAKGDAE